MIQPIQRRDGYLHTSRGLTQCLKGSRGFSRVLGVSRGFSRFFEVFEVFRVFDGSDIFRMRIKSNKKIWIIELNLAY